MALGRTNRNLRHPDDTDAIVPEPEPPVDEDEVTGKGERVFPKARIEIEGASVLRRRIIVRGAELQRMAEKRAVPRKHIDRLVARDEAVVGAVNLNAAPTVRVSVAIIRQGAARRAGIKRREITRTGVAVSNTVKWLCRYRRH